MTLTSLLPSLRKSIPDPFVIDRWPEWTHLTTIDVVVSGVSLLRLVELCDTPCVHIAAAVVPGTHGRPSDIEQSSVVVAQVVEIPREGALILDADLTRVQAHVSEARLIGRASTQHSVPFSLSAEHSAVLPADLRVGDLIAIPCRGAVCRRQLRSGGAS
ncbi:hypothetical protein ASF79_16270 [Agreia sp. Leaf335]|uniref:hypothetical protein n=1 Tax=Agreia sp. Leaf335 TaxID=1736340 RepID=UPI0006F2BF0B|nr:hypothetical protein [Agreia sp. Leaf335]KQR19216.1 hypothetical protein ASF79_16270 [Agreia sp. Leaf335]